MSSKRQRKRRVCARPRRGAPPRGARRRADNWRTSSCQPSVATTTQRRRSRVHADVTRGYTPRGRARRGLVSRPVARHCPLLRARARERNASQHHRSTPRRSPPPPRVPEQRRARRPLRVRFDSIRFDSASSPETSTRRSRGEECAALTSQSTLHRAPFGLEVGRGSPVLAGPCEFWTAWAGFK